MSAFPGSLSLPRFRPAPRWAGVAGAWRLAALTIALVTFSSLLVVGATPLVRLPLALAIGFALTMLTLARPTAGVLVTMAYLVVLAFVRRLLISTTGWWQADPLLLVGPLVAAVLMVKLFVLERRSLTPDLLSKLVAVLLALSVVQTVNPAGGGPGVGVVGLLYVGVPLLWFFIGRELLDDSTAERLLTLVVVLGIAVGSYGLVQSQLGHPPWDRAWIDTAGYISLNVGNVLRPFGTFSSSAEYSLFVGSAFAIAVALALRGRTVFLLALPLLGAALFLASSRGALIMSAFAAVTLMGLRTRQPMRALAVIVVAAGLAFGAFTFFGSSLASGASGARNDLVSHQLGGLDNPLDPEQSTLLLHVLIMLDGVKWSFHHPLGQGTASTNVGGVSRGDQEHEAGSTETDVTNAFVAFGPAGGILYAAIVLLILAGAVRSLFAGSLVMLPIVGVLVVGLGQWLIGGHYALSPLTWLLIGRIAAMAARTPPRPG
ncbi:MAG TPA: hypothetical protein VNT03_16275 [Baekduia sp.]|nr:hypothetical protein [Baekduia sp.]